MNGEHWFPEPVALTGADRPTRRRIRKAFRAGQVPPDPTDRALALDVARRIRRERWLPVLCWAVVVTQLLIAIFDPHRPVRILALVMVVLYALYGTLFWVAERRARSMLAAAGEG